MTESLRADTIAVVGQTFCDLAFSHIDTPPRPGTEVYATDFVLAPGGVANSAIAAARLDVPVELHTSIGTDALGALTSASLWDTQFLHVHNNATLATTHVTVSLGDSTDRTMVTRLGARLDATADRPEITLPGRPTSPPTRARHLLTDVETLPAGDDPWWDWAASARLSIHADLGWDSVARYEAWAHVLGHLATFTPNSAEACALTGHDDPADAAIALSRLTRRVLVTCGPDGVLVAEDGRLTHHEGLAVDAVDPLGAGDVFAAGHLAGLALGHDPECAVDLGILTSAISVTRPGGSASAPTWAEVRAFLATRDRSTRERYAWLSS